MDSRERLRRCFFHEELDRPGVFTRRGFPENDPTYRELIAYMDRHSDVKLPWGSGVLQSELPIARHTEPYTESFDLTRSVLTTPAGDLTASTLVSRSGQPGMAETWFIKSREDAERYLSLPEPTLAGEVAAFHEMDRGIGERGIAEVEIGLNPGGAVVELMGTETFAVMSRTDRDVIHALCEREARIVRRRIEYLLRRKVGPFFAMAGEEYIAPPIHGPEDFRDFNVRYDSPIADLLHEAGCRLHIHCHGSLGRVFADFVDMGVDVLHPVEPPPLGDLRAADAKRIARGRVCIEGNIQIAHMYEHTPDEVRAETESLMRDAFGDRSGLIVSPTASPYIRGAGEHCLTRYRAMVETVAGWKP